MGETFDDLPKSTVVFNLQGKKPIVFVIPIWVAEIIASLTYREVPWPPANDN